MIDLRSDTLTKPTEEMRAAMASAEVGDDVYGEDPTVARLEEQVAGLLGHEAALFTPTGSMANVLAVRSLVGPGQEVLCEASAHIARAELGAHGAYTGLTMRTWIHPRGQVDLAAIETIFAPDMGPFFVPTAAISVENTHNFAGGAVLPIEDLRDLREYATGAGVGVHLDGARLWNAHVATAPYSARGVPVAMWAFQMRAPSTCTPTPTPVAYSRRSWRSCNGSTAPPAKLWVFSTEIAAVGTKNGPMSGAKIVRIASRSTWPRGWIQVRMVSPVYAPCAPSSARAMWALASQRTSWPGPTRERTASTLAIDAVGVNRAAS